MNKYRKEKPFDNYTDYTVLEKVLSRLDQLESRQDYVEKTLCSKWSSQEDQIEELSQELLNYKLLD